MMRKGKTLLALLLALAMTVSALGDSQLFVLAEGDTAEEGASPDTAFSCGKKRFVLFSICLMEQQKS